MNYEARQLKERGSSWSWWLVLWLSIMLLLTIMGVNVYTIVSGILGIIAFLWHVARQGCKWYRNRHPWELTFQVMQIGNTKHHGVRQKSLQIKPETYIVQVNLKARVPTELSEQAAIVTGVPVSLWRAIQSKRRKQSMLSLLSFTSIRAVIKLLSGKRFNNPPPDCPVQIKEVKDINPGRDKPPEVQQAGSPNGWWLHYRPSFTVSAGRSIVLRLQIEARAPWEGYIVFSSSIEGHTRKAYGKVEVIPDT